jgi:hypothetical protein
MVSTEEVKGAAAVPIERVDRRPRGGDMSDRDDGQLCAEPAEADEPAPPVASADEEIGFVPSRVGCRSPLRGWAGAHLHGAVRPRRRAVSRGRPPGRWC